MVGIGNRLKFIANVYAQHGLDNTYLLWNNKGWVSLDFKELFINTSVHNFNSFGINKSRFVPLCSYPGYSDKYNDFNEFWRFYIPLDYRELRKNDVNIDFKYNSIPLSLIKRYKPFFMQLKPSRAVHLRMTPKVLSTDVCVHIRNSDIENDNKDVSDLEMIKVAMRIYGKKQRFFISAMNSKIYNEFKKEFGDQVFELHDKKYSSMVDAVADMYLLGIGKELIASPGSTFSEVAWWLGGCKANVKMLEVAYQQKR